jgi:aminoglycoside phosphotransferase (APT) family kinase protein
VKISHKEGGEREREREREREEWERALGTCGHERESQSTLDTWLKDLFENRSLSWSYGFFNSFNTLIYNIFNP